VVAHTAGHPSTTIEVLDGIRQTTAAFERMNPSSSGGHADLRPDALIDVAIRIVRDRHGDLARHAVQHARTLHRFGGHLLEAVARGDGPYEATPEIKGSEVAKAMIRLHLSGLVRARAPRGWAITDPRIKWVLTGVLD
jgi:hypothetical protein